MSNRLDQEKEKKLQPTRMAYAKEQIQKLGFEITYEDETRIEFKFNGENIVLFPYSGWHQGKGIQAGRGISKLLRQLTK